MRIYRFFINENLEKEKLVLEDKEIFHQIKNVLRLKRGNEVFLFDGKEKEILAEIEMIEKNKIFLKRKEFIERKNEPEREVVLYCPILKRENFELVCQKATEIGVKKILPILTKRTTKLGLKRERLEGIIKEAAEQSGRNKIPELGNLILFEESLKLAKENEMNLFFDFSGENFLNFFGKLPQKIGVFVGPEGGWEEKEIEMAKENGFKV